MRRWRSRERYTVRVVVREWPGYVDQKNYAASIVSHDWILSLDGRRACPAQALADEIKSALAAAPVRAAFDMPRVTWHLGQWIRTTDWVSRLSETALRSARVPVDRPVCVHRSGQHRGSVGRLRRRAAALCLQGYRRPSRNDRPVHDVRRAPDARRRPPRGLAADGRPPAARVSEKLPRARRHPRRRAGLHHLGDELVKHVFLKFAKLWERSVRHDGPSRRHDGVRGHGASSLKMFSLHIDTARTWRGGQNQVLLTVNGLREIGQRAALVAHPDGELRRRASEGLELIDRFLAARRKWISRPRGVCRASSRQLKPDVIHAHDAHGVAMASLALSLRASSRLARQARRAFVVGRGGSTFHLRKGTRCRGGNTGKVDFFIAASDAIRRILLADGVTVDRIDRPCMKASTSNMSPPRRSVGVHEELFWLPSRSAGRRRTSRRSSPTRDSAI